MHAREHRRTKDGLLTRQFGWSAFRSPPPMRFDSLGGRNAHKNHARAPALADGGALSAEPSRRKKNRMNNAPGADARQLFSVINSVAASPNLLLVSHSLLAPFVIDATRRTESAPSNCVDYRHKLTERKFQIFSPLARSARYSRISYINSEITVTFPFPLPLRALLGPTEIRKRKGFPAESEAPKSIDKFHFAPSRGSDGIDRAST